MHHSALLNVTNWNPLIFIAPGSFWSLWYWIHQLWHSPCMNRLKVQKSLHQSKSFTTEGDLLGDLTEASEVSSGFTWSVRFMETASAPSFFSIWCTALFFRIAGFLGSEAALPNSSSETDSKSLNREGHQKHKMMFPADVLKADKVCVWVCVRASTMSVYLCCVHVYVAY